LSGPWCRPHTSSRASKWEVTPSPALCAVSPVEQLQPVEADLDLERERRARILEAAALEIELRGWAQDVHCNGAGGLCMTGAIITALGVEIPPNTKCYMGNEANDCWAIWGDIGDGVTPSLPYWNDERSRTREQVVFALRWRAEEIRDGLDKSLGWPGYPYVGDEVGLIDSN